jgi:hypothetical protein
MGDPQVDALIRSAMANDKQQGTQFMPVALVDNHLISLVAAALRPHVADDGVAVQDALSLIAEVMVATENGKGPARIKELVDAKRVSVG